MDTRPETRSRAASQLEHRLRRWRSAALPIAQAALAAGLSWLIAVHIGGHRVPFFAPVAAVVCLSLSLGERLRRVIELIVGVAIDHRGQRRRPVDLQDRYGAMANHAGRGAGDVGRRVAGLRSYQYRSGRSLGHPHIDAPRTWRCGRDQPIGRWADRGRDRPLGRRRVPANRVYRSTVAVTPHARPRIRARLRRPGGRFLRPPQGGEVP